MGPGLLGLIEYSSGGTTVSSVPVYKSYTVLNGDQTTVNNLPALTVVVAPIPEPASAAMLFAAASGLISHRRKRNV